MYTHIFNFFSLVFIIGQVINFGLMAFVACTNFMNDRKLVSPSWLATTALIFGQFWLFSLINSDRPAEESFWKDYYDGIKDKPITNLVLHSGGNLAFLSIFTMILSLFVAVIATIIPLIFLALAKLMPLLLVAFCLFVFVFGGRFACRVIRENTATREGNYAYFRKRVADLLEENKRLTEEAQILGSTPAPNTKKAPAPRMKATMAK